MMHLMNSPESLLQSISDLQAEITALTHEYELSKKTVTEADAMFNQLSASGQDVEAALIAQANAQSESEAIGQALLDKMALRDLHIMQLSAARQPFLGVEYAGGMPKQHTVPASANQSAPAAPSSNSSWIVAIILAVLTTVLLIRMNNGK